MTTTTTTTYKSVFVEIDDFGPFPAKVENERRWNGFAIAWFTWETVNDMAQQIAADVRDPDIDPWIEITPEGFMEHGDEDGPIPLLVREINGTRYFSLQGGWCWMETDTNA